MSAAEVLPSLMPCSTLSNVGSLVPTRPVAFHEDVEKLVGNFRLLSYLGHLVSSLPHQGILFILVKLCVGEIWKKCCEAKSNWDICWSAESVIDKQVLVVVIQLIAMIESKSEVEEGARWWLTGMVGGRGDTTHLTRSSSPLTNYYPGYASITKYLHYRTKNKINHFTTNILN